MSGDTECVAYVPRSHLEEGDWLRRGFRPDPDRRAYRLLDRRVEFGARPELETDPSRKQLIPYIVVRERGGDRIFTMQRRSTQSETRLHNKLSIGAGGHVSEGPESDADDPLRAGMQRELHEELRVPDEAEAQYRGLLNDDSNDVGRVHLGLVYTLRLSPGEVDVREVEKMEGAWRSVEDLEEHRERLESWTRLLLEPLRQGSL